MTQGLNIGDQIELNGKTFHIVGTMAVPNYVFILKTFTTCCQPTVLASGLFQSGYRGAPGGSHGLCGIL